MKLLQLFWKCRFARFTPRAVAGTFAFSAIVMAGRAQSADSGTPAASIAVEPRLTIDDAIAQALAHNQQIKVSDFGRGIGRANVLAEYGHFDPSLTFNRTYSYSESAINTALIVSQLTKTDHYSLALTGLTPWGLSYQIGGFSDNQRESYNQFSNNFITFGGVSITQPLLRGFGFGANLANLRIAKADRAISDWQYRQTVIDTVTNVIVAYDDVVEAHEELRIARRSRDLAAQLVHDNERRNSVGYIADADVTQARARAASREELILLAARQVKSLENRLRELMGDRNILPNGPELNVEALTPQPIPIPDGATELRRALELRPDYQEAKLGISKRRSNRALARNQLLPRLDFVGSFGYNGIDQSFAVSRAQVRSEDNRAYTAGVVVSVPLTFAEGRGRYRAAKLALQQSESDLDRLEQDIAVSVANAIGQLETTTQRVEAATRAYVLAQQALDGEEKKFKAGTSTTFQVLQLQEQLVAVESSKVRAIADQRRAVAFYEHEIGSTLINRRLTVK